jgi:hypothetical protein
MLIQRQTVVCNEMISVINTDIVQKNCSFGEVCQDMISTNAVHLYSIDYLYDPSDVDIARQKKIF